MVEQVPAHVAVVVPAHQAAATLGPCLDAILSNGVRADRIIVVDDGSTDGSGDIARRNGVRVFRNDVPLRPARARNRGVEEADADIVVFVDADVVLEPGALSRLLEPLDHAGVVAAFGSYNDSPPNQSAVSKYRNLLHYFTHQAAAGEVSTFWTGFGAVRRDAFLEAGGFDAEWENIEDVELGLRLSSTFGRIVLRPDAQAAHLKEWTIPGMFRTDAWGRALPWTRLILSGRMPPYALNGARRQRGAALGVVLFGAGLVLSLFAPALLFLALAGLLIFLSLDRAFFGELFRIGGWSLLLPAIPAHMLYYVAAMLGYGTARFRHLIGRA